MLYKMEKRPFLMMGGNKMCPCKDRKKTSACLCVCGEGED